MTSPADASRSVLLAVAAAAVLAILWAIRDVVMLAAFALLIAYTLEPLVAGLERLPLPRRLRLSRPFAAGLVVFLLAVIVLWLAALTLPRLGVELGGFIQRIPTSVELIVREARRMAAERGLLDYVDPALAALRDNSGALVQRAGSLAAGWIGRLFGGLAQFLGIAVLPVLAFYLLAERAAVQASVLRFVPEHAHARLIDAFMHVDRALQSYVRGQTLVCVLVGTTVAAVLAALGVPLALLLGVVAGLAEVVPFLGAFVTTLAIALVGLGGGTGLAVLGVVAYLVINNGVGLLVAPHVMGRHLKMHPFVVTVSILAGASLLGPAGALLALPGAAVLQALVSAFAPPAPETGRKASPGPR